MEFKPHVVGRVDAKGFSFPALAASQVFSLSCDSLSLLVVCAILDGLLQGLAYLSSLPPKDHSF
jgi:hypothetical protein